jgi:hypothetical protein
MESSRIGQFYGYAVCLIALAGIGFGLVGLVNGAFAYLDPLANATWSGASLRSYDDFKVTYRTAMNQTGAMPDTPLPSDGDLRTEFVTRRQDAIAGRQADALRTIVGDAIVLLASVIAFRFHWRWLQRRSIAGAW